MGKKKNKGEPNAPHFTIKLACYRLCLIDQLFFKLVLQAPLGYG
nr:MAG TPA: hypothetical protein [Caudoviricetes sp.]DAR86787.1 MAG TPA: hypothetical protein [Caudoviricetes sp.]